MNKYARSGLLISIALFVPTRSYAAESSSSLWQTRDTFFSPGVSGLGSTTPLYEFLSDCLLHSRPVYPLFRALIASEDIFRSETRDADWADSTENTVEETATSISTNSIVGGCRTSICQYEVLLQKEKGPPDMRSEFLDELRRRFEAKHSPVISMYEGAGSPKSVLVLYVFRTSGNIDWKEGLITRMPQCARPVVE